MSFDHDMRNDIVLRDELDQNEDVEVSCVVFSQSFFLGGGRELQKRLMIGCWRVVNRVAVKGEVQHHHRVQRLNDIGRVLDRNAEKGAHHTRELRDAERVAGSETAAARRASNCRGEVRAAPLGHECFNVDAISRAATWLPQRMFALMELFDGLDPRRNACWIASRVAHGGHLDGL